MEKSYMFCMSEQNNRKRGDRKNSKTVPHGMILGVAGAGRQEIAMRDIIEMMQKYPEDHFHPPPIEMGKFLDRRS